MRHRVLALFIEVLAKDGVFFLELTQFLLFVCEIQTKENRESVDGGLSHKDYFTVLALSFSTA